MITKENGFKLGPNQLNTVLKGSAPWLFREQETTFLAFVKAFGREMITEFESS
jgi:hypothetical protein